MEYGYVTGGRPFGNWKVHLGLIPYVAWLVLTYIATKPKWFIKRYNPKEMFEIHRIVGIVSVVLVCAHWYVSVSYTHLDVYKRQVKNSLKQRAQHICVHPCQIVMKYFYKQWRVQ